VRRRGLPCLLLPAFEAQSWGNGENGTYREMIAEWDQRVEVERAKIAARAQLLCDTYAALITLGDVSIRAEYHVRQKRAGASA
jgi:hypothetical protein